MLATAPDLHNVRFLSFSTVFAAVLAVFLSRAVTSRMRALVLFFGQGRTSFLSGQGEIRVMLFWIMLSRASDEVKLRLSQVCPQIPTQGAARITILLSLFPSFTTSGLFN